jgi:NitT/TauT family transport system permease protein
MKARAPITSFMARHPRLSQLATIALFLLVWEITARFFVDKMFLSPPSRVYSEIDRVLNTKGLMQALTLTLYELSAAFVIAVAIGMAIGLSVGLNAFARRCFMPIILLLYGIPQIVILPLFILGLGIGPPSKIAFGVTHGIFPIILAIVAGVQNLKPVLLTSARSMGANRWHVLRYVVLPHMMPSFFSGLRLGMTGVLLGVLLAELYVSTAGIGYFTGLFTQNFDPTRLLGLISILAAMAIVLNEFMRTVERRFSRWRGND